MKKNQKDLILILPNIRSAVNVGSIFRTADGVGISKIYLTGYSPTPKDKFNRSQKDIAKTALGAENWIDWEYKKSLGHLISKLKKENYFIVAIEQDKKAKDYRDVKIKNKTAFILGPEVGGLEKNTLKKCDAIAEIPMFGKKESLNISVACGIALFRMIRG